MYLLGLAPGGVYLAANITARAGGLLHHLFTLTLYASWHSRNLFSVALAVGLLRLAVSQHRALWSADFPQHIHDMPRSPDQPGLVHYKAHLLETYRYGLSWIRIPCCAR